MCYLLKFCYVFMLIAMQEKNYTGSETESQRVRAIRREAQSVFAAIKVLVTREVVGGFFL